MRSYHHIGGDVPLIGTTLGEWIAQVSASFADRAALVSIPQGVRYSYAVLDREVVRLAKGLMALGVGHGDRVGIWSPNNAEWIVIQLATARIGAVLVNINPAYKPEELQHALALARVQVLCMVPAFRTSRYTEMIEELCPEARDSSPDAFRAERLPDLRRLIVYDPDDVGSTRKPARAFLTWADVESRGQNVTDHELRTRELSVDTDDAANIQFTSGTTGLPKAVVLTHHNILNNAYFVAEAMGFSEHDRLCVPVPFYHCFGTVVASLACLSHGAAMVIPAPHFDAHATLTAIESERCTAVHGVPTMFIAELDDPELGGFDLSSLRTGIMAGAPCPPELVQRVIEDMRCPEILIGYGQTEASPVTHITRPDDGLERRVRTVGTNLPHQEVKVIDPESGVVVALGEPGELCFRGYHVMRGYFEQDEATRRAVDGSGWLHSGDLGVMDEDGYVRITGRLKDMIIRGGENIYPAEIENVLFEHPKVSEVAVFGVPDSKMGEEVGAWIKLHEGETGEAEEFRELARERLAHFKVPRYIWLVDEFPLTITGKIQKFKIREIVASWAAARASERSEAITETGSRP